MTRRMDVQALSPDHLDSVSGDAPVLGVYKPGPYKKESKAFFKACIGDETYERAMSCDAGRLHHYVPARVFLTQPDWEKFCWIEQYGTLDSFPG